MLTHTLGNAAKPTQVNIATPRTVHTTEWHALHKTPPLYHTTPPHKTIPHTSNHTPEGESAGGQVAFPSRLAKLLWLCEQPPAELFWACPVGWGVFFVEPEGKRVCNRQEAGQGVTSAGE